MPSRRLLGGAIMDFARSAVNRAASGEPSADLATIMQRPKAGAARSFREPRPSG